ncbi:MAG: 6-phosphofructokinase [Acidimicrobiia bacterium]|nr:6-phosphofructokinase [Acidimicrobiia bacterium]
MQTIGVLTSGGDAPGMNAAIFAAVKVAAARGIRVIGIERGYDGAIDGNFRPLTRPVLSSGSLAPVADIDLITGIGGTILGSTRCRRFYEPEYRTVAAGRMQGIGLDGLIVIGGNGSLTGAHALALESGSIPVVGIPASIDNDIGCTSDSIGVDTAVNTIIDACDRISDTARSHQRAFIVEVMGRHSGYLAMVSSVATAADAVLLPEVSKTDEELITGVEKIVRQSFTAERAKRRVLIIKAEGVAIPATRLAREVEERLSDHEEVEVRATVLGHVVRGGRPTYHDRMLAGRLALGAVSALVGGANDVMTAWNATTLGGTETGDPRVSTFRLEHVLEETNALLDGTSDVSRRRVLRMQDVQGVLAL